jgi:pyruvate-formate lyase-activating enzyme
MFSELPSEAARLLVSLDDDRIYCVPNNIWLDSLCCSASGIKGISKDSNFSVLRDLRTDDLFLFSNPKLDLFSVSDKDIGYYLKDFKVEGISTPYKTPPYKSIPVEIPLYGNTINPVWAGINLGGLCNSHCTFCYTDWLNNVPGFQTNQVKSAIDKLAEINSIKVLLFSGGEPTIRRDLLSLFEYANQAGFLDIALHTNGRELKDHWLVERMVELGLKRVLLSLHGQNAEVHDKITNSPNSFSEVLEGLRNLRAFSIEPTINTVMCQDNYRQLSEIVKFLSETLGRRGRIRFSYPIIEGAALENIDWVLVPFSQLKPSMLEAMRLAEEMGFEVQAANMPLCIPDQSHRDTTYDTQVLSEFVEVSPFYKFNVPRGEKSVKLNSCMQCSKASLCRGIQIEYLRTYPESAHEFTPIKEEIKPNM